MIAAALVLLLGCHTADAPPVSKTVLERKTSIKSGVGTVHESVTTSSKEAQAFYDQGLAFLHNYVWIEAARSFHQSLRHDPKLAMAWVGLSRAQSGLEDAKAAKAALEKAKALAGGASEREKRRIELRAKQLAAIDDPALFDAYRAALDAALAADPKDVELLVLRGNAEEPLPGGRGQMGGPESIVWYAKALEVDPAHFGAHHYLVHSYENVDRIDDALKHGEIYVKAAPDVPHAQHMYGHDLRRVGRVKDAIAAFEKADALERAWYANDKVPVEADWHRPHNLSLLAMCWWHQGKLAKAEKLFREASAIPAASQWTEFNRRELVGFLLARGRNAEALKAADALANGKHVPGRVIGNVLAGEALVAMKKTADAEKRIAAAEKELAKVSGEYALLWKHYLPPNIELLRAEIALTSGSNEKARAQIQQAITGARELRGPDAWSLALFQMERMGRVARDQGDWALAEWIAAQMMEHDPAYGGAHWAMAEVAKRKGDAGAAKKHLAEAKKLWAQADPDLPELK